MEIVIQIIYSKAEEEGKRKQENLDKPRCNEKRKLKKKYNRVVVV
jgi:hypothetical protein